MTILMVFLAIISFQIFGNTPLNSSVMIYHESDLDQCSTRVAKLELAHNSRVQLIPTIYGKLKRKNVIAYYYKDKKADAQPITKEYLDSYHAKLINCIQVAHNLNMEVYFTPHIDDLKAGGVYRNKIDYDPIKKYRGISFSDIMFSFLAVLPKHELSKIHLSLIGEMGRSLNHHMISYAKLVRSLPSSLNIGLSFNFTHMLGQLISPSVIIPFINELDFLGVSAYYPMPLNCNGDLFEKFAQIFYEQMRNFGMIKPLRLHFTEVGIGGHRANSQLAQLLPHKGVSGAYSRDNDPWRFHEMKRLRYKYHRCLLNMLKKTPTIQAAFLWNSDSWDVQGVYPYSHKYRDEMISLMIEDHNLNISFD